MKPNAALACVSLLAIAFPVSAGGDRVHGLDAFKCVAPDLLSYWRDPGETVVAFTANGLYRDFQEKLPAPVFSLFLEASEKALREHPVQRYGVGLEKETDAFVENVRAALARSAGLKDDAACGIQVQGLLELVNSHRYVYKAADAPTSWASRKGLSELNVSNVQLVALIGTYAPDQTTSCRTVYEYQGKTIRVCN